MQDELGRVVVVTGEKVRLSYHLLTRYIDTEICSLEEATLSWLLADEGSCALPAGTCDTLARQNYGRVGCTRDSLEHGVLEITQVSPG